MKFEPSLPLLIMATYAFLVPDQFTPASHGKIQPATNELVGIWKRTRSDNPQHGMRVPSALQIVAGFGSIRFLASAYRRVRSRCRRQWSTLQALGASVQALEVSVVSCDDNTDNSKVDYASMLSMIQSKTGEHDKMWLVGKQVVITCPHCKQNTLATAIRDGVIDYRCFSKSCDAKGRLHEDHGAALIKDQAVDSRSSSHSSCEGGVCNDNVSTEQELLENLVGDKVMPNESDGHTSRMTEEQSGDAMVVSSVREPCTIDDELKRSVLKYIEGTIPDDELTGLSTGWPSLDRHYRVVRGEMTIVTGRPGNGKSEWMASLIYNMAERHGWRFCVFSFETTVERLMTQLLEKRMRTHFKNMKGEDTKLRQHLEWITNHFIIQLPEDPTIDDVLSKVDKYMKHVSVDGVIIDPYNYLGRGHQTKVFGETHFINQMLMKMKQFADKRNCHVWMVAHPSKSNSWCGGTPNLYDIAGSAHWYNKTDMGIVVSRVLDTSESGETIATNETKIEIQKVRNQEAGQIGEVILDYDANTCSYRDSSLPES